MLTRKKTVNRATLREKYWRLGEKAERGSRDKAYCSRMAAEPLRKTRGVCDSNAGLSYTKILLVTFVG